MSSSPACSSRQQTTEQWNRAAEQTVAHQAIPVSRIGLEDLFSSTIDWDSFSLETPEVMVRVGRKTLREHQKRALTAVTKGLVTTDRGKLIMASGIVNDSNDWMDEGVGAEPGAPSSRIYLLDIIARVTTVSVRTQEIVADLPPLDVRNGEV